ncbi:MAG: hypothetical protein ACE5HF_04860 [Gemmatimonadota bacterium]
MMRKILGTGAAVAAAIGTLTFPAYGQERPTYELPPITVVALQDADALHARAIRLYETPARWTEAAQLHLRAARSLAKNDARSFQGFDRAARLLYYTGDFAGARRAMEKAAGVARATGDLVTAAHAYLDAAFISVHEGYSARKRALLAEAEALSESELVADSDRNGILARIDGRPAVPLTTAGLAAGAR